MTTSFGARFTGHHGVDEADAVVFQGEKLLVAGTVNRDDWGLVRYDTDGVRDPSFGQNGKVVTSLPGRATASALVVQPDGKIVVVGGSRPRASSWSVTCPTARSTPDSAPAGSRPHLSPLPPERMPWRSGPSNTLLVAGWIAHSFSLMRFDATGQLDPSFGVDGAVRTRFAPGSTDVAHGMALQADGKIVLAGCRSPGYKNTTITHPDFALARYETDGALDGSFGFGGLVITKFFARQEDDSCATDVAMQNGGGIVAAGEEPLIPGLRFLEARYLAT